MIRLTFEERGYKTAYASMLERHGRLRPLLMKIMQKEKRALVRAARDEAPKDTGQFARGINGIVLDGYNGLIKVEIFVRGPSAWLLPLIVGGTKPHEIPTGGAPAQMAKGYPLRFYWENGPNGPGVYRYWRVWHPGTKPNPFPSRALRKRWPKMKEEARLLGRQIASMSVHTG